MSYQGMTGKAREKMLHEAKRQLFRKEVKLREDNRTIANIALCYYQLNHELFDGCLPEDLPVTYNNRLSRTLGKAFYKYDSNGDMIPTKIELRKKHPWTRRFLRKVLTHEMCHIWAYQEHNENGHGRHFWNKMKELGYPKTHDWDDSSHYERDIYC